jgi:serine phosphatase RsbU (regulator of sigma subunit)
MRTNSSGAQRPIRIILVDDQSAPGNISAALASSPDLQFVGQAANSQEAVQLCQLTGPNLALINLNSPSLDGISVIHWLTQQWPQIILLVLSGSESEETLRAALEAGAAGYLPKNADPADLAGRIQQVVEEKYRAAPLLEPLSQAKETPPLPKPATNLRTTELIEAARIQSSMLPAEPPPIPGWDLAVKLQPARETSGDFFDFIPLDNGKYGIVIGDVSDKGLGAALFMAMTSTLFRTFAARHPSLPALTMSLVNERILSDTGGSSFVTAFLGVLEPTTGRLRYANAGHMPPLLLSVQKGKSIDHLVRTGMALGVMKDAAWQQKIVKFTPGDFLLLYTDGILDAQNSTGEFYGEQRLLQTARAQAGSTARQIVEAILGDVAHFTGEVPVNDDVILMALARKK